MFQSLLEGKTDCPISGVFGAGKTLSAAAMIAGLLVMDPSLKIMIVTKENVAAHAFVKHFLRLELPESINCLVGRLVGYVEMKKGPANRTALDIPPAFGNDVLRNKQVIVGCGGFHQECQQPYSPVASWMEDTDVALLTKGSNVGTWVRPQQLQGHRASVSWSGVVTTNKRLAGYGKLTRPKPLGGNSCAGQLHLKVTQSISNPIC